MGASWGHRRRSAAGQIGAPAAMTALGVVLLLLAVYVLRPAERDRDADEAIQVRYIDGLKPALALDRGARTAPGPVGRNAPPADGAGGSPRHHDSNAEASRSSRLPGLATLLREPRYAIVEFGMPDGDFVYQSGRGWLRHVPDGKAADGKGGVSIAGLRLEPVAPSQLPPVLAQRYPPGLYPLRGRRSAECSPTAGAGGPIAADGPWILRKELAR